MKLESLLEQYLVLHRPLVGERCEVGQIEHRSLQIVFVPEQHSQCLFSIVTVLLLGQDDVLVH